MNVNPSIIAALSPLGIPVDPDIYLPPYEGAPPPDEYITFNYVYEDDVLYGDDDPLADETAVQIHYFTKGDPQEKKKAIRKLLRSADFVIQPTEQTYETDTKYNHIIIPAVITGNSDE